jgi:hypothetical protein
MAAPLALPVRVEEMVKPLRSMLTSLAAVMRMASPVETVMFPVR